MFANLKSLLSVYVAPGGSYVSVSPFSFPFFTRIEVASSAGEKSILADEVADDIDRVVDLLAADRLIEGRKTLEETQRKLREVTGQ